MSTPYPDWSSAPDFHPEFGLLCPSPRKRRSMRLVVASVMAGMAIGATIELAVAHWRDGDVAQSPAASSIDDEPLAEGSAVHAVPDIPVASARPPAPTADTAELTALRPQEFCKDAGTKGLAAAFLNPTCGSARPHTRRSGRTTYRVATVIVGRTESPPAPAAAEPTPVAVAAIEPPHTVVAAGKPTILPAQDERPAPPRKLKPAPSAPIVLTPPTREPARYVGSMAFAAVPRPGSGYYDRPADIFGAAAMPPSFAGPFGGIW
jgi:hypothetical protein